MPKRTDIKSILIIGAGPIVIGQACEFDYSGAQACKALKGADGVEKINIGALGNVVRQLHVHVVGRHAGDTAWPGPVWGSGAARRHDPEELAALTVRWRSRLG